MIKKLQHKIILIITVLLTISVVVLMFAINIMSQGQNMMRLHDNLEKIASQDGLRKEDLNSDFIENRTGAGYLWIMVDYAGDIIRVGSNFDFESISAQEFIYMKDEVLSYNNEFGFIDDIAYLVMDKPLYGAIIVFTSASSEM